MPISDVVVKGAREHNLQSVDVVLPRNQLICLTGVSGSGKSSLAFDTVYAEGQRRYVESLSSFARHFLGQMPKPEVDYIAGLSPSISISQKSSGTNPRSTVGTITEIYDFLPRAVCACWPGALPYLSPAHHGPVAGTDPGRNPASARRHALCRAGPAWSDNRRASIATCSKTSTNRASPAPASTAASCDSVIPAARSPDAARHRGGGRSAGRQARRASAFVRSGRTGLEVGPGHADRRGRSGGPGGTLADSERRRNRHATSTSRCDLLGALRLHCTAGLSFEPPSPQLFSFNSPQGMCPQCDGLGQSLLLRSGTAGPRRSLSFKQGAIEIVGVWKEMGRWRRHIYQGVADDAGTPVRLAARRRSWTRPGVNSIPDPATCCCGAPGTSTSRSPGAAARRPSSTEASTKGSFPTC